MHQAVGEADLAQLGEQAHPQQPAEFRQGGHGGVEDHQGQAERKRDQGKPEHNHLGMLATAQFAHAHVGHRGEQRASHRPRHTLQGKGEAGASGTQGVGHHQHPQPTQRHGQGDEGSGPFAEPRPGQQGGDGGVEELQHRGGSQGQSHHSQIDAEEGGCSNGPAQGEQPAPLAQRIEAGPAHQPATEHHAHQGSAQHHLRHRQAAAELLHAHRHQAEAEGPGQQRQNRPLRGAPSLVGWITMWRPSPPSVG